jgi:hypothetical protein
MYTYAQADKRDSARPRARPQGQKASPTEVNFSCFTILQPNPIHVIQSHASPYCHPNPMLQRIVIQCSMHGVGQNRTYTPYTPVYLVISLQKIPYMHHRIYMVLLCTTVYIWSYYAPPYIYIYIWSWPTLHVYCAGRDLFCVLCYGYFYIR